MMDTCELCGLTKEEHKAAGMHHTFSVEGELTPLPRVQPKRPATASEAVILRLLSTLAGKGIITAQEAITIVGGLPDDGSTANRSDDNHDMEKGAGPTS